jgi:hypothetical protein
MLGLTDPGVGLTEVIGETEGVADPARAAKDALAADAVTLPGVNAVALPVIGVALAEIGAVAAALGGGTMTWAAVAAPVACPALAPPWPIVLPMLGPTDPGVGLIDEIGEAEDVADPARAAKDALAVDAVALPGVDAAALPVIGVALAEIGAVVAALLGGTMTWAAEAGGVV